MYKNILVPVDGSDTSEFAAQAAIKLAQEQQAKLRFVYVIETNIFLYNDGYIDIGALLAAQRQTGKSILDKVEARGKLAGVICQTVLLEAEGERVARVIADEAQRWPADLIAMGTHGRGGFDHLIFGSVAEGVVHITTVPILLMRKPKELNTPTVP